MRRLLLVAATIAAIPIATSAVTIQKQSGPAAPVVIFTTVKGVIEIETFPAEAPKSVARFVDLARRGFYRATRFHWVQPGVAQGGDQFSRDFRKRDDWGRGGSGPLHRLMPIGVAEISNRKFDRGIVGMAYLSTQKPTDADCQFFILKVGNPALNGKYAAIGRVIKGMAVVDKIELEDMIKDVAVR